jgi:uncharacterized membrane protein
VSEVVGTLIIGAMLGFFMGVALGWTLAIHWVNRKLEQITRALASQIDLDRHGG